MLTVHTSPLAVPGGYAAGGMNVYIRETALTLARRGYAVDIYTRDDGSAEDIVNLRPGVRVISVVAGPRAPVAKESVPELLPQFLHGVRSFRQREDLHYDLLHSHYWHAGWVASLLAPRWGVPHVTMFHTLAAAKNRSQLGEHEPERRAEQERRVVARADRIVCAGEHEKRLLIEHYGADPNHVAVIPCGVDLRRFRPMDPEKCRRSLGLGDGPLVLYAGRIEPLKGIDIVIDAMAQLVRNDARLLVVGGDGQAADEIERLRARAEKRGIGDRVRFIGAVEQSRLPLYYNAANVCVVPSAYESFGLVAVEAMACGVPVVATRVGGLATTIRDGATGYLIPWRCAEPFAERIDLLLENDELRRNLGRAARASVLQYGWQRISDRLAAEYTRLWQDQAQGPPYRGARGTKLAPGASHFASPAQ